MMYNRFGFLAKRTQSSRYRGRADPPAAENTAKKQRGWAQVNGGTLLTPSEKDALDEWYLRNASFGLDFRIILMTARVMIWGQRRPDDALARAQATTVCNEPVWPEVIRPEGIALEAAMVRRPYMTRSVTPPRAPL